jgi:hypothetical protein
MAKCLYCDSKGQFLCIMTVNGKVFVCHNTNTFPFTVIIHKNCPLLSQFKHFAIYCHNTNTLPFTVTIQILCHFTVKIQTLCHLLSQYKHFAIYCHNTNTLPFTVTIHTNCPLLSQQ